MPTFEKQGEANVIDLYTQTGVLYTPYAHISTPNVLSHSVLIVFNSLVTYMLNLYSNTRKDGIFMNRRANSSYFHEADDKSTGALYPLKSIECGAGARDWLSILGI